MAESLPATAFVRVSWFTYDVGRFAEIEAMNTRIAEYLIPAIKQLPGILHFYAAVSPEGSAVHVSVWDTEEHAKQLDHLKEMVVIARGEAEAAGATFHPVINYPVDWSIFTESAPATAGVARFARGSFDANRFADVEALSEKQSEYLVPAITPLPGLVGWYSAVSPAGSIVQVSVWDSVEHSEQMSRLQEMAVTARGEMDAAGVVFEPILNYPIGWTI